MHGNLYLVKFAHQGSCGIDSGGVKVCLSTA